MVLETQNPCQSRWYEVKRQLRLSPFDCETGVGAQRVHQPIVSVTRPTARRRASYESIAFRGHLRPTSGCTAVAPTPPPDASLEGRRGLVTLDPDPINTPTNLHRDVASAPAILTSSPSDSDRSAAGGHSFRDLAHRCYCCAHAPCIARPLPSHFASRPSASDAPTCSPF